MTDGPRTRATPEGWHAVEELAQRFDRTPAAIEALARHHHWPRVNHEHGVLIGVDLAVLAEVLGASAISLHGGAPPQTDEG